MAMDDKRTDHPLTALQRWFRAQCDGAWEKDHGITIETLENPGWSVTIDLAGTALAERPFTQLKLNYDDSADWLLCRKSGTRFEGFAGPEKLDQIVATFVAWAERHGATAS